MVNRSSNDKSPGYIETEVEAAKRAVLAVYEGAECHESIDQQLFMIAPKNSGNTVGHSKISEAAAWIDAASKLSVPHPPVIDTTPKNEALSEGHDGDLCDECGLPRHTHPSRVCDEFYDPKLTDKQKVLAVSPWAVARENDLGWAIYQSEHYNSHPLGIDDISEDGAWFDAARNIPKSARLSHPEIASHSNSPTCPLPLHNPLQQKDGTFKCSSCDKTWSQYPSVKVVWPKARTK